MKQGTDRQQLALLYGKEKIAEQERRIEHVLQEFETQFGGLIGSAEQPEDQAKFGGPARVLVSAPGRTEIGGNHTDHQNGCVLAASVEKDVLAAAAALPDPEFVVFSEGFGEIRGSLADLTPEEAAFGTTEALIRGVCAGLAEAGFTVGGFAAYLTSDVPGGSGMSSSAAFETAIGLIQNALYNEDRASAEQLARAGHVAENRFFGKPCGLMDQMACSVGGLCFIDFQDPQAPGIRQIAFDPEDYGYVMCITDTGSSHADLTADYAAIPEEMGAVAAFFGQSHLRGLTPENLLANAAAVRASCGDRAFLRALHFVQENNRARQEADALSNGDFQSFLDLFRASANSSFRFLQNVTSGHDPKAQDLAVAIGISEALLCSDEPASCTAGDIVSCSDGSADNVSGDMAVSGIADISTAGRTADGVCRVHGGGFAGTVQTFVKKEKAAAYAAAMDAVFGSGACQVIRLRPLGGARLI